MENKKKNLKLPQAVKDIKELKEIRNGTGNLKAHKKLKLLFVIVDHSKQDFYTDLLHDYDSNLQISIYARGTAPSDVANYLGIEDNHKSVIIAIIQEDKEHAILDMLDNKIDTVRHGYGIAFTISLDSMIGVMIYQFLANEGGKNNEI